MLGRRIYCFLFIPVSKCKSMQTWCVVKLYKDRPRRILYRMCDLRHSLQIVSLTSYPTLDHPPKYQMMLLSYITWYTHFQMFLFSLFNLIDCYIKYRHWPRDSRLQQFNRLSRYCLAIEYPRYISNYRIHT